MWLKASLWCKMQKDLLTTVKRKKRRTLGYFLGEILDVYEGFKPSQHY